MRLTHCLTYLMMMVKSSYPFVQSWADDECPGWARSKGDCCIADVFLLSNQESLTPILIKIKHPILDTFQLKLKNDIKWGNENEDLKCENENIDSIDCEMVWNDVTEEEEEESNVTIDNTILILISLKRPHTKIYMIPHHLKFVRKSELKYIHLLSYNSAYKRIKKK